MLAKLLKTLRNPQDHKTVTSAGIVYVAVNDIASSVGGVGYDFRAGQIGHSVANGSSLLRHSFCVPPAQSREDGPCQLIIRFVVFRRV